MFVRSVYNYDVDEASYRSSVSCEGSPSRTQQHFRDECDINVMIQRFQRTGIPDAPPVPPGIQDFTRAHDFRSAMQVILDARSAFDALPSKVRERFMNDPHRYLEFVNDPDSAEEAIRLGIAVRREPPPPSPPPGIDVPVD